MKTFAVPRLANWYICDHWLFQLKQGNYKLRCPPGLFFVNCTRIATYKGPQLRYCHEKGRDISPGDDDSMVL